MPRNFREKSKINRNSSDKILENNDNFSEILDECPEILGKNRKSTEILLAKFWKNFMKYSSQRIFEKFSKNYRKFFVFAV